MIKLERCFWNFMIILIINEAKQKFYKMAIRPTMLYGYECLKIKDNLNKKYVEEMRMLSQTSANILGDK